MLQHGCARDATTCAAMAAEHDLCFREVYSCEFLKLLREEVCARDIETMRAAAENDHTDLLQYAHKNGCP